MVNLISNKFPSILLKIDIILIQFKCNFVLKKQTGVV